jgi:hypothetical protein
LFKILVEGSNSDCFTSSWSFSWSRSWAIWIAACINFALMSVAVSWNFFGGKGFVAGLAAWLLVAGAIWGPYRFSMPRKLHAPVGEDAVWAAARGTDLPAFQRAVDGCGLDCSPAMIQTLYNVLAMRGNIAFVRDLQARSPTHLSSLAEASHHRARLEAGTPAPTAPPAPGSSHHLDGMTAALFGPLPALRQLMLDYAAPHELHNGLHYAIRADAPERVAELLQRGASLERAVLMSYDNHRLQAARASRLALVELLIEARAARVLKWFLTDGRAHLDALDATRNKGEADALHLWARAASQHEARFGTLDSHLPVLDGLLAEPAFRDTAPSIPRPAATTASRPVSRHPSRSTCRSKSAACNAGRSSSPGARGRGQRQGPDRPRSAHLVRPQTTQAHPCRPAGPHRSGSGQSPADAAALLSRRSRHA